MNKKVKIFIAQEVNDRFPELEEVVMPVYGVTVKKDEGILIKEDYDRQLARFASEDFYNQEILKSFRGFCEMLGADLERNPPSVEFLYRRYQKSGYIPHINNVVDSANKVALETLVATGVFDMDKIEGDMVLRFSKEGEEFRPLGGDIEYLPAGLTVIADDNKILNLFPFRDSIYQRITEETKNVLVLADNLSYETRELVVKAVEKVGELIVKHGGGVLGDVGLSEADDQGKIVFGEKKEGTTVVKTVFAGCRPTGRLHVGNYLGSVRGMIELANNPNYDSIFSVVDLHGITTPYDPKTMQQQIREVVLDYLGAGLDPKKCHLMIQSQVPEHVELSYLIGTIYPVSRLEDLPTYKDKKAENPSYVNMGLLYYPVLMAADIMLYKAELVPVGKDQFPHIEVTREFVRNFNRVFGDTFPEPKAYETKGKNVPSLKGEGKMSKSIDGSYILLTDDLETIKQRLAGAPTDSGKGGKVPIQGGVANLLTLVELFEGKEAREVLEGKYLGEGIKYSELKAELAEAIYKELKPIQARRREYENNPKLVDQILEEGREYCSKIAKETIREVKEKMGLV